MSSWWNNKTMSDGSNRSFDPKKVRGKAAAYADSRTKYNRDDPKWDAFYRGYLSGYLTSQREKFANIRLRLKQ